MADPISAVSSVIRTAVQIRRMCERAKACRSLVDVIERKMASLIPVMAEIQDHIEEMDTTAVMNLAVVLGRDIRECRAIVQRASQMSKISYIVHSNDLREQIERNLRAIHLALMSLQASQNTYIISQNQRLADEFRKFHLAWQQRERELRREEEREARLKSRVAKSLEECNRQGASDLVRRQSVAKAAGIKVSQAKWFERELARARSDHEKLVAQMKRDKDTVARSKAKADAMFMDQIITALAINESMDTHPCSAAVRPGPSTHIQGRSVSPSAQADHATSRRGLPDDCFCPITNHVMEDPIIVDAPCHHTLSRQAARQWFGMGKTTCPVCGVEVDSHHLSPNVQVRNITESLLSDGLYQCDRQPRLGGDVIITVDSDIRKIPSCHTATPSKKSASSARHERINLTEKCLPRKRILLAAAFAAFAGMIGVGLAIGLKPKPVPNNDSQIEMAAERSFGTSTCGSVGDTTRQCGSNSEWGNFKLCCEGLSCDNATHTCTNLTHEEDLGDIPSQTIHDTDVITELGDAASCSLGEEDVVICSVIDGPCSELAIESCSVFCQREGCERAVFDRSTVECYGPKACYMATFRESIVTCSFRDFLGPCIDTDFFSSSVTCDGSVCKGSMIGTYDITLDSCSCCDGDSCPEGAPNCTGPGLEAFCSSPFLGKTCKDWGNPACKQED